MPHVVSCRARTSSSCLHLQPTLHAFGEDLPLNEDRTFDGTSIVCDPCYVALMPLTPSRIGLIDELPAAIARARRSK